MKSKTLISKVFEYRKLYRKLANLQTKEDELKKKDQEVQQNLILFGQALDDLTKKSQTAMVKTQKEEDVFLIRQFIRRNAYYFK